MPHLATSLAIALAALTPLSIACAETSAALPTYDLTSVAGSADSESTIAPEFDHRHAAWTELLQKYVRADGVDYEGLKAERAKLQAYIASLASVTPTQLEEWSEEQRFAFWINVYNASCIDLVVGAYPIESIRELGGSLIGQVWDKEFIPLTAHHPEGDSDPLSLNDVEHAIIRERFMDARLHAAVNCASYSCPPLRDEAFVAERLDEQLTEQMRAFVADTTRNRLNRAKKELELSEIFKWFESDFERDAESVQAYVARFAPEADRAWILEADVEFIDYDWALNDVK